MNGATLLLDVEALTFGSRGISEDAREIGKRAFWRGGLVCDVVAYVAARRQALAEVQSTFEECAEPDWDGYGAQGVRPETYAQAVRFLLALPTTVPKPEVTAEPDGEIAFEWYRSGACVFVVSVGEGGILTYTFRRGRRKAWGVTFLEDEVPRDVLAWIWEVTG
jgi:hypothetical protein